MARSSVRAGLRRDDGRVRWFVPLTLAFLLVSAGVAWAADVFTDWADVETDIAADPTVVSIGPNTVTINLWATGNFPGSSTRTVVVTSEYNMGVDGTITPGATTVSVVFASENFGDGETTQYCTTANLGCRTNPHQVTATLNVAAGTPPGTEGTLIVGATHSTTGITIQTLASGYVIVESGVTYVTNGFKSPVATGDWNKARAGQGISLRWNLWENEQTVENEVIDPVLNGDSYSIRSMRIACPTNGAFDPDDVPAEYAGSSSLRYDYDEVVENASGHNVFVWKTDRGWDGTCRQLTIMYDGSATDPPLTAFFDFRK